VWGRCWAKLLGQEDKLFCRMGVSKSLSRRELDRDRMEKGLKSHVEMC
jgi:hypothetical protein